MQNCIVERSAAIKSLLSMSVLLRKLSVSILTNKTGISVTAITPSASIYSLPSFPSLPLVVYIRQQWVHPGENSTMHHFPRLPCVPTADRASVVSLPTAPFLCHNLVSGEQHATEKEGRKEGGRVGAEKERRERGQFWPPVGLRNSSSRIRRFYRRRT